MVSADRRPSVFSRSSRLGATDAAARITQTVATTILDRTAVSYASPFSDDCGKKARAIVFQGFPGNGNYLNTSSNRVFNALSKRPYDKVYDLRFATETDNIKRKMKLLNEVLPELAELEELDQLDIFYSGHGAPGIWVLGGDNEGYSPTIDLTDLAEELEGISATKINIIVDACHSGAWAADLDTKTSPVPDGAQVKVLASCKADQKSGYNVNGSKYTEALMDLIEGQAEDAPFDYDSVVIPRIEYKARTASGIVDAVQDAENHVAPPENPILYLADEEFECQVSAVLDSNNYERKITIRGAGFGATEGSISIYRWEFSNPDLTTARYPIGGELVLDVDYWSDNAITFFVPMRSRGIAGDPKGIATAIGVDEFSPVNGLHAQIGRYFVQVTKADGKQSPDYRELPLDQYGPQLVHVWPQVETVNWTPDFTDKDSVEWNEMWLSMTPESQSLGTASVWISDMRLVGQGEDEFPTFPTGWQPIFLGQYPVPNYAHNTGAVAAGYGSWSYELVAAERNLATSNFDAYPEFNYWGFRQLFEDMWNGTATWKFTLIFD